MYYSKHFPYIDSFNPHKFMKNFILTILRGRITCPRSQSKCLAELDSNPASLRNFEVQGTDQISLTLFSLTR